jgi:putative ABC transport system permease protein
MHAFLQDVALATRSLRRSRAFVIVTVLSLGLALGVTTTMFGIVDATLNPAVPLREPARVVTVSNAGDGAGHGVTWYETFEAARRSNGLFEQIAIASNEYSFLRIGSHYDRRPVLAVSPNFFAVTGVRPFLGRAFAADGRDAEAGDAAMVIFRLWRSALGGARDLRGSSVEVEGRIYRVVGVLPPYLPSGLNGGVYLPMQVSASAGASARWASLVARLAPGVAAAQAERTLRSVVDPVLTATYGVGRRPFRYRVRPVLDERPAAMDDLQRILLASAFVVLVIACGNLANLMLARGLARERDYALCFALGARRANVIRQTLVEGLLCALAGAALGVLIAVWAFDLVTYRMTREVPVLGAMAVSLNWRIFAFSVLAAVVTTLVFAMLPAIRTSNVDLNLPLKSGAGTTTRRVRSRFSALVVGEVALTMTLMLGAGLLMKAVRAMRTTDLGYNPHGLLQIDAYLARATSNRRGTVSEAQMWRLLERVRSHPGVIGAALEGIGSTPRLGPGLVSALAEGGNRRLYAQNYSAVSPDFLRTVGVPVTQGRDFAPGDAVTRGAVIVNEAAARVLWPSESPVGRMLKLGDLETDAPWLPVVGISRDVRAASTVMPVTDPVPQVWVVPPPGLVALDRLRVRVPAHGESQFRTALDRVTRQTLPPGSIVVVRPWLGSFDDAVLARDFVAKLFVVFGAIALGLAAVGLYCLVSFTVAERRREFAVRCALGATGSQIARMVVHDATIMVLAGTGVGAFLAMWLARALDAMLYSVFYTDVAALLMAEGVLIVVALVACLMPARRAARSDPVEVMRSA